MPTFKTFVAGLMACLLGGLDAAHAAPAAPLPAELFFKEADLGEATLSPSGRKLALTTAQGAERRGLVVFDLAPGGKPVRAVQFKDADVANVQWVNEDRLVFSALDFSEGSGRPSGAPGLFAVNADGSDMRMLVRRQGRAFVSAGDTRGQALEWNHRLLRVPAPQAGQANDEVLIGEMALGEPHTLHPLWLNTRSGRTRRLDLDAPANPIGWLTDRRGEPRVVFTVSGAKQSAYWRPPGSTEWARLYESDLISTPFAPLAVDDAGTLYVTRREGPDGLNVLTTYDPERKAPAAKALVITPGFDFAGQLIAPADGRAMGVRVTTDAETTVWFNERMKALQQEADTQLPGRVNRISCRRCGASDMVALITSYSDRDPGRLWLYQGQPPEGEKAWRPVGRLRKDVDPAQMASMELHRIKARDGRDLPVWVTTPANTPEGQALPAVVLVHGGPWVRGGQWHWNPMAQFLASRGYRVIEPEFRGSTGYGATHFKAGFKQWGQAMQDDVADALLWAQQQKLASTKACIAGASYGGYSTLMGLIRHPELYRCAIAWVAVADLPLFLEGSWFVDDDLSGLSRKHTLPDMVGDPKKDEAMVLANSPVHQAARIQAPLLLAFGSNDRRVPLAHGERLRSALQKAGKEPEWVVYEGEGHGWAVQKNQLDFAARVERFLATHLLKD